MFLYTITNKEYYIQIITCYIIVINYNYYLGNVICDERMFGCTYSDRT